MVSNEKEIAGILKRATAEVIVEKDLRKLLLSDKKLRLKEGFDPSFPDIHLGHMVALRKLRQFQELGHQVVLIVGDWTARIGDPSGATVTRPMLSAERVKQNAETYMKQFFKIVDKDKTEVHWQSEWFDSFHLNDVVKLTSKFTIAQMLARDDFNKRYNENRPITITEFLYPLLQAYDSVSIKADVEFGGTDQKFNLLVGRELQASVGQKPQHVFLVPILTGTDGVKKMSKSLGNYIGVAEPPEEIFGKIMSIPDSLIMNYLELLTDVPDKELKDIKQSLSEDSVNPMEIKKRLAKEIIAQLYDSDSAIEAERHFRQVIQNKEAPEDIPVFSFSFSKKAPPPAELYTPGNDILIRSKDDWDISRILVEAGLASSKSEANRLIAQGAVSINGKKIDDKIAVIKSGSIIKVGKRRFAKVINSDILD